MTDISYLLLVMLVMTVATYATRLTPFMLFSRGQEKALINFIAKNTPPMIMTILVIYMLKGVHYLSFEGVYTFIAILVTVCFSSIQEKRIAQHYCWHSSLYDCCTNLVLTS